MRTKFIRHCAYCGVDISHKEKKHRYCSIACGLRARKVPFWDRVRKSDTCWEWTGCQQGSGYGYDSFNGKPTLTHRIAWILTNGPITDDQCVLHKCDNRACVRPDHLFLGTRGDNMHDAMAKGRNARGERRPEHKLTDAIVQDARARHASGRASAQELADEFGVHVGTMHSALRRKTWKHVV